MYDQRRRWISLNDGHLQRRAHQRRRHSRSHGPAQNLARVQVQPAPNTANRFLSHFGLTTYRAVYFDWTVASRRCQDAIAQILRISSAALAGNIFLPESRVRSDLHRSGFFRIFDG